MSTLVLAALVAAARLTSTPGTEPSTVQREVAYEAIATGHADDAIRAIEARLAKNPDDPALLINLGAAYAARGDNERAAQAYQAAVHSDTRYDLELADGTWTDSRQAARRGLETLQRNAQLAKLED